MTFEPEQVASDNTPKITNYIISKFSVYKSILLLGKPKRFKDEHWIRDRNSIYLHFGRTASNMKNQENTDSLRKWNAEQIELLSRKPGVCFCLSSNSFHWQDSVIEESKLGIHIDMLTWFQMKLVADRTLVFIKLSATWAVASLASFGNPLTDPESIDRKIWKPL